MSVRRGDWVRRYPPLLGGAVALVLSAFVLPSSLNVTQSNPQETLEYAPVPPSDEDAPPVGNGSSLGLGSSGGLTGDGLGGPGASPPPLPGIPGGEGSAPRQKRCVGNPPRQTEDPLAPPCVAFFEGDNFGATATGVTRSEVRVLFYLNGECDSVTARGTECPQSGYYDANDPPREDDHARVRMLRTFQRYFNDRFQTYGRFVHFYLFVASDCSSCGVQAAPEVRISDAAANYAKIKPFAVVTSVKRYAEVYQEEMARRGVLIFGSLLGQDAAFFSKYAKHIWSVQPSIEESADVFASYVCTKVVGRPVAASGNAGENGKPRKLGLLWANDETKPGFIKFTKAVRQRVAKCGAVFAVEGNYPVASTMANANGQGESNAPSASTNMARFQQLGVTTIVWPQGFETEHSKAAENLGYLPEWVIAGDYQIEGFQTGNFQSRAAFDGHALVVTQVPLTVVNGRSMCRDAQWEADPTRPERDVLHTCGSSTYYDDLRLMFTAIQVAGPRLTVNTIDQGLHAIPPVRSTDPSVPACFFDPGDYTCIKDAAVAWWDYDAPPQEQTSRGGCWRYAERGQRHFARDWPKTNTIAEYRPDDPCSRFAGPATK